MFYRLLIYLAMLFIGILIGYMEISHKSIVNKLDKLQVTALIIILFVMGIRIGADKSVFNSIGKLGGKALIISLSSIAFSVLFITVYRLIRKINKQGEKI